MFESLDYELFEAPDLADILAGDVALARAIAERGE